MNVHPLLSCEVSSTACVTCNFSSQLLLSKAATPETNDSGLSAMCARPSICRPSLAGSLPGSLAKQSASQDQRPNRLQSKHLVACFFLFGFPFACRWRNVAGHDIVSLFSPLWRNKSDHKCASHPPRVSKRLKKNIETKTSLLTSNSRNHEIAMWSVWASKKNNDQL